MVSGWFIVMFFVLEVFCLFYHGSRMFYIAFFVVDVFD